MEVTASAPGLLSQGSSGSAKALDTGIRASARVVWFGARCSGNDESDRTVE